MKQNIPTHVGIIVDGNGRWATERGLSRSMGHLEGSNTLWKVAEHILNKGVKVLSVFVFSTENFKRSKEEVDYLMKLFIKMFTTKYKELKKKNIKVIFSGRTDNLPPRVIDAMKIMEEETKNNSHIFNVCLGYGGKQEIIDAVKKIVDSKIDIDTIDTDTFKKYLYNDLPDIDLLIRTSGEMRISNFMLYQLAYAELFFSKTYWPDFTPKEFDEILEDYAKRHRRFGGYNQMIDKDKNKL